METSAGQRATSVRLRVLTGYVLTGQRFSGEGEGENVRPVRRNAAIDAEAL